MVITITMKNVRLRNGIYEFRMAVPADCQDAVGKKEITQSLQTGDASQADVLAKDLTAEWKTEFKKIRAGKNGTPEVKAKTNDTVVSFKARLKAHLDQHLDDYLVNQTKDDLVKSSEWLLECMAIIRNGDNCSIDLSEELGIAYPLPDQQSPGMTRRLNKAVIDALARIRQAIDDEAGWAISDKVEEEVLETIPRASVSAHQPVSSPAQKGTDIEAVMNLMLDAQNIVGRYAMYVRAEVKCLQEWLGGKSDITSINKSDMVDFVRNCLPHIPKNMTRGADYEGKSLRKCVELTKKKPAKYVPISHQTCTNRLAKLHMVFSYAQDHLGIITVNPAKGIEIPKVRVLDAVERNFTADELSDMRKALAEVYKAVNKRPERYWIPMIGLYHGFRLNEICSLRLKDIYQHADGTYVIDVNADGAKKKVKNKSSIRIVPIHPYVLDSLGFRDYIEKRNANAAPDDLLFPNLTYTETQGFSKNMSVWFNSWKTTWLPAESRYKNFHSLRHTFVRQAQNQAKMSDRCNQEITGHSVSGVSRVHMGYSGRLQPTDVLLELSKVKYGWE